MKTDFPFSNELIHHCHVSSETRRTCLIVEFFQKKGLGHVAGIPLVPTTAVFTTCTQFELFRFNVEETAYSSIVSYWGQ